jgi:ArsR family metal-binding transcriptional regulator
MITAREIHIARPCIEDPKLFIAESNFGRGLDMEIVCTILTELAVPEMRCSTRLGVARFRLDDWQIMIYGKGRVDIRRVSNVDDASRAIDQVEKMLQNAFLD